MIFYKEYHVTINKMQFERKNYFLKIFSIRLILALGERRRYVNLSIRLKLVKYIFLSDILLFFEFLNINDSYSSIAFSLKY